MSTNPLPTAASVADLVTMLVGKKALAKATAALPTAAVRGVATYADAAGKILFVALADLQFLAGVGAALAMIPPAVVNDAIKEGKLSGALQENAFEVMNIVASLYNDPEGQGSHVKIQRLAIAPPPPIEKDLAPRLVKPLARLDLEIQIPGYTNGKLSLLAVA